MAQVTDELVDVLLTPLLSPGAAAVVFDTLSYSAGMCTAYACARACARARACACACARACACACAMHAPCTRHARATHGAGGGATTALRAGRGAGGSVAAARRHPPPRRGDLRAGGGAGARVVARTRTLSLSLSLSLIPTRTLTLTRAAPRGLRDPRRCRQPRRHSVAQGWARCSRRRSDTHLLSRESRTVAGCTSASARRTVPPSDGCSRRRRCNLRAA